jgi:ligand-binding sensor domain-containing protein
MVALISFRLITKRTKSRVKINRIFIGFILIMVCFSCHKKEKAIVSNNEQMPHLQEINKSAINDKNFKPLNDSAKKLNIAYSVEQLDNTKGLSNSSINTIFEDSENLLWIGTWDGLNRYDGGNFKIYRPELDNEKSLSNQVILKIAEDHTGQIWILTIHGINRFDKKTGIFHRYYFSRANIPPQSESEFNMALDFSNNVFCAVKDWGIGYFDGSGFQLLDKKILLADVAVRKMEFASNDELLVLFENNDLYALSIKDSSSGKKKNSKVTLISKGIRTISVVSKQRVYLISTKGRDSLYSGIKKKMKQLEMKTLKIV